MCILKHVKYQIPVILFQYIKTVEVSLTFVPTFDECSELDRVTSMKKRGFF